MDPKNAISHMTTEQVYQALADAEHAAWLAVAQNRPGTPGFNQAAWDAWTSALHAVCNASPRSMERFQRDEGRARIVPEAAFDEHARADGRALARGAA